MLRTLTALRFPAALAVFLWHAPLTKPYAQPLSLGYLGVGFFFLLSGFILTYNYHGAYALRRFYVARVARVLPVHLLGMAIAFCTLLFIGGEHWSNVAPSQRAFGAVLQALLLQSWCPLPAIHFGLNGPSWSLSDEAWFYAAFPLLGVVLWRVFGKQSEVACLAGAAALCALIAATTFAVRAPFDQWAVYVLPLSRTGDFAAGMLLGIAYLRRTTAPKIDGTMLELSALAGLGVGLYVTAASPAAMHFYAAMMPFSAAAIYVFAQRRGWCSRLLEHPALVYLGEASYAFYVIHFWIVHTISNFVLSLLVTVLLSVLIFRYFETPLRRLIRARFAPNTASARPAPVPAAVPAYQAR